MEDTSSWMRKALKEYDCVRFTWVDVHGMAKGKTVPKRNLETFWKDGIRTLSVELAWGPQGKSIFPPDEVEQGFGNKLSKVVPHTLNPLPWAGTPDIKVGEVLCECLEETLGQVQPHGVCTRTLACQQIDKLHKEFGLKLYSSFESEFQLLDQATLEPVFPTTDMLNHLRMSEYESFLFNMQAELFEAGINTESFQLEAAPGQFEYSLIPSYGIEALDLYFRLKNGIKEISMKKGLLATFMAKPFVEGYSSAGHYNLSLWDDEGKNVFYDANGPNGMSSTFKYWLAGLVKHAPALTILCCPTVNCYRFLHQSFAPHAGDWGIDDRRTSFRIRLLSPDHTFIESRMVSAAANPYLVATGILAAGMDGLKNKLELQKAGPQDKATILPKTLAEAAEALESDEIIKEALGDKFMTWYLMEKRECEIKVLHGSDISSDGPETMAKERDMYLRLV